VPVLPGVFSALGLLLSEMREEQLQTCLQPLAGSAPDELAARFAGLEAEAAARLGVRAGTPRRHRLRRRMLLRFQGQSHTLPVDLPDGPIRPDQLVQDFNAAHERLYGYTFAGDALEIVTLWAVVTLQDKPAAPPPYRPNGGVVLLGERTVHLEGGSRTVPVYQRFALAPGAGIAGPAIIEQPDTTTLLLPGQTGIVDAHGHLILRARVKRSSSSS